MTELCRLAEMEAGQGRRGRVAEQGAVQNFRMMVRKWWASYKVFASAWHAAAML
jgi:hypothetical protein